MLSVQKIVTNGTIKKKKNADIDKPITSECILNL